MPLGDSESTDDERTTAIRPTTADAILGALETLSRKFDRVSSAVEALELDVKTLRKDVYGTSTPPPPAGGAPIAVAARQGSAASLDVEELRGELLAVRAELARQSSAMGLGLRGLRWVTGPEGRATVIRLATLAGVAYAAFHAAGVVR